MHWGQLSAWQIVEIRSACFQEMVFNMFTERGNCKLEGGGGGGWACGVVGGA